MWKTSQVILFLLSMCCMERELKCSNILAFYPYPAKSHHRAYWPLLKELAIRGHNVTMFSPLTMPDPPPGSGYKEIKIKDYSNELTMLESAGFVMSSNLFIRYIQNSIFFMRIGCYLTDRVLEEPIFQWLLESDSEFDLILGEWTFSHETFSALHHRFKAANIELTSFGNFHWTYWLYGQPFEPSYIADSDSSYSDRMDFTERLQNTLQSMAVRLMWYWYYMPQFQRLMDQHIRYPGWEKRPGIMELLRNNSLVLMNTHFSLNYPYPNSPHFKEIGGINILPPEPLPKDIQKFMDEASEGVIYFSLGSFLQGSSVLEDSVYQAFVSTFSKLKQRVLWKWESTTENLPNNIMTRSWLPQQGILAHKNCRLFISHSGFLSLTETVYYGVPVVAIPIWADQLRNAKQMTSRGYAIQLDFNNLSQHSIEKAIKEILDNPTYKKKAIEQSRIFRDKPNTPLETAVYWTEYVLRHGGAHHLKPAIATMPWYQQAMLDVYVVMSGIAIIFIYIIRKTFVLFASALCKSIHFLKKKYT